jgi:predicted GNAT family N-acyltransferase
MLKYAIEVLDKKHDKLTFSCKTEALNRYLHQQANQDIQKNVSVTYVLTGENENKILGYYTLASTSIDIGELPVSFKRKLPSYPNLPAILLGRLAVDQPHEGKGLGTHLLIDALKRSLLASLSIGATSVMVHAKDKEAVSFYAHFGFIQFENNNQILFLPMNEIRKLFDKTQKDFK